MENQVLNNNPGEEYLYLTFGMLKKIVPNMYNKLTETIKYLSLSHIPDYHKVNKSIPISKYALDDIICKYISMFPYVFYGLFCVKTNGIISGFVLYKITREDCVELCLTITSESSDIDEYDEDIYSEHYCIPTSDIFDDIFGIKIKIKGIENINNVNLQRWDKKDIIFDLLDVDVDALDIDRLFDMYHSDYETKIAATIKTQIQSLKGTLRLLEVMQNEIKLTPNSPEANQYFSYLEKVHVIREQQKLKYGDKYNNFQKSLTKDEIVDIVKNYQASPFTESSNPDPDPFKLP